MVQGGIISKKMQYGENIYLLCLPQYLSQLPAYIYGNKNSADSYRAIYYHIVYFSQQLNVT